MDEFDDLVLDCFLEKQLQLFPEPVAETREEAAEFLTDCLAVVADSLEDVAKNPAFVAELKDIIEYRTMEYYRSRYEGKE